MKVLVTGAGGNLGRASTRWCMAPRRTACTGVEKLVLSSTMAVAGNRGHYPFSGLPWWGV